MLDKKWVLRFLDLANLIAAWSKDPSTKVGAVIFDARRTIVGVGFNGFPRGVRDNSQRYSVKSVKYKLIVHSEANAILNANRPVRECGMITTKFPCSECAKLIAQAGIVDVFTPPADTDGVWSEDANYSRTILEEAGVVIHELALTCPAQSSECEIRGECTNKCGRKDPPKPTSLKAAERSVTGIPSMMEEADND